MTSQRPDEGRDAAPLDQWSDDLLDDDAPVDDRLRDPLIEFLSSHLTDRRRQRMQDVLQQRTHWITVVLEDIFQPHNASAVLRSCECFGVQTVHVVEDRNDYTISRDVALGASRWLDLERWRAAEQQSIDDCCDALQDQGYRLVAATPRPDAVPLQDFDITAGPVAVMFGTELDGLTAPALARATEAVHIPMHGFTESFNISVSAALILRDLSARLRASSIDWRLDHDEAQALLLRWQRRSLKRSDTLIKRFLEQEHGSDP